MNVSKGSSLIEFEPEKQYFSAAMDEIFSEKLNESAALEAIQAIGEDLQLNKNFQSYFPLAICNILLHQEFEKFEGKIFYSKT